MSQSITSEVRAAAIAAAVHSAKSLQAESRTIKWKGHDLILPVASVSVDLVLLNPHSHRIQGRLESLDSTTHDAVKSDPFGAESQALIQKILHDTEGYQGIRNTIGRDGQTDPGVLTVAGVLINANTRVVALRELRQPYVRVIVLPSDATSKELIDMELQLQMEVDVEQSYTLTSGLLFIEDLIRNGRSTAEIGRSLRVDLTDSASDQKKAKDFVDQELRLLSLIREVQSASNGQLTFVFFDDKRQALIEIDQDYQKLKIGRPDEATRVRDAQLTGLLSGIDYRNLREIDRAPLDDYLVTAMEDDPLLTPHVQELLSTPQADGTQGPLDGLDLLDDDDEEQGSGSNSAVSLSTVYGLIASTGEAGTVTLTATDHAVSVSRRALVASMNGAIRTAIQTKALDARAGDILLAPRNYLKEAVRAIDKARDAFVAVSASPNFDRDAFDRVYDELERAAADLADECAIGARNG